MRSTATPAPKRTGSGPAIAAIFGCLGVILLGILAVILAGGITYFTNPKPNKPATSTPPLSLSPTYTSTIYATPSETSTATSTITSTPTNTPTTTATFIFHPPTLLPTSTKTPIPQPTKTRTPRPTATPVVTIFNDTRYEFNFNTWLGINTDLAFGKGMRCSSKKGESLTFTTPNPTHILSLFFHKGPKQGKVRILVDDKPIGTLDLYQASPTYRFEWNFIFPNPDKSHKIKIVVLREKRLASTGYQICFDGLRADTVFTDDTSYAIRYGAWSGIWSNKATNGGYRLTKIEDSQITFTTRGRSFRWITARGPNYGKAAVYVDSQLVSTVDLYFPTQMWQQTILIDTPGPGEHVVSIVALGKKNPASTGSGIVFDGIILP